MNPIFRTVAYAALFFVGCSGDSPRSLDKPKSIEPRFTIGTIWKGEHSDMDSLLNTVLPLAKECVDAWGQFPAFTASMRANGHIVIALVDSNEHVMQTRESFDILREGFQRDKDRGEIRAFALCYDVVLRTDTTDMNDVTSAICVDIEHVTEGAVRVHVRYRMDTRTYSVEYDSLSVSTLAPIVFTGTRI